MRYCDICKEAKNTYYEYKPDFILWILCETCLDEWKE